MLSWDATVQFSFASPLSRVGDFLARSHFARSNIPEEKWGLLVV